MGRDHLADQQVFHSGLGAEVFVDEGEQLVEFFARLAGKHDGSGEEAVTHGVLRGTGFAFGRLGPRERAPLARDAAFCFSVLISLPRCAANSF